MKQPKFNFSARWAALALAQSVSFLSVEALAVVPPQPEPYCYAVADSGDNLVYIRRDGDTFTNLGATGTTNMEAIAFNPATAIMYGSNAAAFGRVDYDDAFDGDGNDSEFIQISAGAGTCTLPGGANVTLTDIDGLTFDLTRADASTGTWVLWAVHRDGDGAAPDDVLFQIDPTTGLLDTSPTPGFDGGATCVRISGPSLQVDDDDLGVDPTNGSLLVTNNVAGAANQLILADPVTGDGTNIRLYRKVSNGAIIDDMEGQSFGLDGQLYGTTGNNSTVPGDNNTLWQIEKETGEVTLIAVFPSFTDYEAVTCLLDNLVTGTVYFDANANGAYEPAIGDEGYAGARVVLYIDNNNDNLVDVGDTQLCENAADSYNLDCPVTNSAGFWQFAMGQGNIVAEVDSTTLPATSTFTTDNVEEASFANTDFGLTDPNNDFGFTLASPPSELQLTKASNADADGAQAGEIFQYTLTITNNDTVTHTEIEVTDSIPLGLGYVPQSTTVVGRVWSGMHVADLFGTASYANNDGSDDWATSWTETDLDGSVSQSPSDGEVQINAARLNLDNQTAAGNFPSIERTLPASLNLTTDKVMFTFILRFGSGVVAGDSAVVEVDSGGGYSTLETFTGIAGSLVTSRAYEISGFRSAATKIRFRLTAGYTAASATFSVDTIRVAGGNANFADNFNAASYATNSGTAGFNFSTNWLEINEADGAAAGDEQSGVVDGVLGSVLRVRNISEGVQREVDLSPYSLAFLTFSRRRSGFDNSNDYVLAQVSSDGGTNWTTLDEFAGPTNDAAYVGQGYDITSYIATNTRVRFITSATHGAADNFFVENLQILVAETTAQTKDNVPAGANPDLSDGTSPNIVVTDDAFALSPTQSMTVTFSVQVDNPLAPGITSFTNLASATSKQSSLPATDSVVDYTPVTLAFFASKRVGSKATLTFGTATEVGNIGFRIHALQDGEWVRATEMVPSQSTDSINPLRYVVEAGETNATAFALEAVDLFGRSKFHGPFALGRKYGGELREAPMIDWRSIRQSHTRQAAMTRLPANRARLLVSESGIQRVSYEQLSSAGLDLLGAQPAHLALTLAGQPIPVRVEPSTSFGPGSFIEFVGEKMETLYQSANTYVLRVDPLMARRARVDARSPNPLGKAPGSFRSTVVAEEDREYSFTSPNGDPWFDARVLAFRGRPAAQSFALVTPDRTDGPVEVRVGVWGGTDFPAELDHHVVVKVNGQARAEDSFDGISANDLRFTIPAKSLQKANDRVEVVVPGDLDVDFDLVHVDEIEARYARRFVARNGTLAFEGRDEVFEVTGLTSPEVSVYRVLPQMVERLTGVLVQRSPSGGYAARFPGSSSWAKYFIANSGAIQSPTIVARAVTNPMPRSADLLIVSHPDFIPRLAPLVSARESQGWKVAVVDVEDIYDEFGHGAFHPEAIRSFIKAAAQKVRIKAVLLVGGDTFDYKDRLGIGGLSHLPSIYAQTGDIVRFAPADGLLVDLDGDEIQDLAIGRFPVRTNAELDSLISRTLEYDQLTKRRTIVMAADKRDEGSHFDFTIASERLGGMVPTDWTISRAYLDQRGAAGARQDLLAALDAGPAVTTFMGHSAPGSWTFDGLLTSADAAALQNVGRPTVVTQWGCWTTYFVSPARDTMAHRLLLSGDRGAAAVLGATTLTRAESERALGYHLFRSMFRPGVSVGDAVRIAKADLAKNGNPGAKDVLLGWNLLGDPTLSIASTP
ncbi:MAG: DUF11 domain-containing protein [Deltaproteobacteria bacterium]|nr:DUF11 domain-containing protein [Deltaproteobacteria bacterium]